MSEATQSPGAAEVIEELILACGSGMHWMEQVSRSKLRSATRGILTTDMGMCSTARSKARLYLEQRDRAWAIVNDIAEGIDNGESRAELRQALAIYADHLYDALQAKADDRTAKMMEAIEQLASLMKSPNDRTEPLPPGAGVSDTKNI